MRGIRSLPILGASGIISAMAFRFSALVLLASLAMPAAAADEYDKALAYYETRIDRPPLVHRLGGMRRLARTKDPRALKELARRYAKPRVPKEHERYLLAAVIGEHFTGPEHIERLWKLARAFKKDEHAWLWVNALGAAARHEGAASVTAAVLNPKLKPYLRAAALEALVAQRHPAALRLIPSLLGAKLPRKGVARVVLLESCAAVLLAHRDDTKRPAFQKAARAVVDLLAREEVPERTRLVIARYLARIYETNQVTTDHAIWRRAIVHEVTPTHAGASVVGRPRFYGIEAAGTRVAYLLDLSDSMLDPLTARELEDARSQESGSAAAEEGIDWRKVRNRFDLARAYLRRSLLALDPRVSFLVIAFGARAETFRSTKSLVRASRGAVAAAVKELDAIEARHGNTRQKRPHGTLRGTTNLHGALLRAYRAGPRKLIDGYEHVDPGVLMAGCDTIFVFSDGKPTKDDFDATDRFDGGTITLDREKGEVGKRAAGSANYFGPYVGVANLLTDLRRMNLFRKAEIHTVAMGEADTRLMRRVADLGLGRYRSIGMLGRGGKVNAWWLLGPYPAGDIKTWGQAEAPEKGVDLLGVMTIGAKRVRWKRVLTDRRDAIVNLEKELGPADGVAAYAYAEILVRKGGPARLHVAADDGVRVWLNDAVVHSKLVKQGLKFEEKIGKRGRKRKTVVAEKIDVTLRAGLNRILVKICDDKGAWRFCLRVTDLQDAPLSFLMK